MKRVLITGATGFLGRYVLAALQQHQWESVIVGRQPPPTRSLSDQFLMVDCLQHPDWLTLFHQLQPTHLLHLAWYAEHGLFWHSPLNLRWVEATMRLVEAFCLYGGQRVVIAGTCAEYDWTFGYCREEQTPLVPQQLYGIAKDATRRLTEAICRQHDVSYAWGRIFFPFGAGEHPNRLIPAVIAALRGQRPAFAVNLHHYRDFLHASDLATAFTTVLASDFNGTINLCSGTACRIEHLVQELAAQCHADPTSIFELSNAKAADQQQPAFLIGDNSRLHALGWYQQQRINNIVDNY
jgi:nucleoside-diphosphate-sugar epimerase